MSAYVADVTAVMVTMRKVSSREIAVDRLREVTKQDRAACGDGRWVRVKPYVPQPNQIFDIVMNRDYWQFNDYEQRWARAKDVTLPRYRWEPRR